MKRLFIVLGLLATIAVLYCSRELIPQAPKIPTTLETHGIERTDDYYWMRDRDNPAVLKYLRAENRYRERMMAPVEGLQDTLFQEMKSRIKEDDSTVPAQKDSFWYYRRYEQGKEYPIYCRKKGSLEAPEDILLDVNELAEGKEFCDVRGFKTSPDHQIISYAVDFVGRRKYTLRFKPVDGAYLEDEIPDMTSNFVWANDNQTVFYCKQHPETLRWEKIFKHTMGQAEDELVFHETDETYYTAVGKTLSEDYLTIFNESTLQTEYMILNANFPDSPFETFLPRQNGHEYSIAHGGDRWYILSNKNAKNFQLLETPEHQTDESFWRVVVPHNESALLTDMTVFENFVILEETSKALDHLRVLDRRSSDSYYIDCEEPIYVTYVAENREYDTNTLRYIFESPKTPETVYDYDLSARTRELKKQRPIPGDFDSADYATERLWVPTRDGVQIPVSILYRKGLAKNNVNPTLIHGYGSYGISSKGYFRSNVFSLVDRGFIFALAHVRGGSEMGRTWYEQGRQLNKKNSFTDFIEVTRHLIVNGYTSPEHLYARGGSAGGLLVGAVANMAPELYNGIIAEVPFVDVVTTMLDESIPLTTSEYDEWGNPIDKGYFDYMLSYSPYDNVEAQDYPNMLITAGLHDSQVQYWEPAKWTAKLREHNTGDNMILLYTNMAAGHGGASGRFQALREEAMQYAFVLMVEERE